MGWIIKWINCEWWIPCLWRFSTGISQVWNIQSCYLAAYLRRKRQRLNGNGDTSTLVVWPPNSKKTSRGNLFMRHLRIVTTRVSLTLWEKQWVIHILQTPVTAEYTIPLTIFVRLQWYISLSTYLCRMNNHFITDVYVCYEVVIYPTNKMVCYLFPVSANRLIAVITNFDGKQYDIFVVISHLTENTVFYIPIIDTEYHLSKSVTYVLRNIRVNTRHRF